MPAKRQILLNAAERTSGDTPVLRHRFTVAYEIGHWVYHCLEGRASDQPAAMRRKVDLQQDADWAIGREASIFSSKLLMPEAPVRLRGRGVAVAKRLESRRRLHSFRLVKASPLEST